MFINKKITTRHALKGVGSVKPCVHAQKPNDLLKDTQRIRF